MSGDKSVGKNRNAPVSEMVTTPGMGWQTTGDVSNVSAVNVSAVTDPSAAHTDPGNESYRPNNRAELRAALSVLVDDISDDDASMFFDEMKDAVNKLNNKKDSNMKKSDDANQVESVIRNAIRKMLKEAELPPVKKIPAGVHGQEYLKNLEQRKKGLQRTMKTMRFDEPTGEEPEEETRSRKNVMMTDVGGASFKDIAAEMGYASESGAKQAVEKALEKARFAAAMDPDELDIIVLSAMNDYVDMLSKSGELTPADVQLMKSHPAIVSELEGFRDHLDKVLKRARKSGQQVIDPVKD